MIREAVNRIASNAIAAVRSALGIKSPSRVWVTDNRAKRELEGIRDAMTRKDATRPSTGVDSAPYALDAWPTEDETDC